MPEREQLLKKYLNNQSKAVKILKGFGLWYVDEDYVWSSLQIEYECTDVPTEIFHRRPSVDEIVEIILRSKEQFGYPVMNISFKESILPFNYRADSIEKAKVGIKGETWIVHKYDKDIFPSNPYAHLKGSPLKLHLGTGDLYEKLKIRDRIKLKDLLLIRKEIQRKLPEVKLPTLDSNRIENEARTIRILDIDLDFFLNNKHTSYDLPDGRLNEAEYHPWQESAVKEFLENNCNLSNPVKGKFFVHHDEVFNFLQTLQEENDFKLKFSIDHLDAHADLGLGDSSYVYIYTNILNKPVKDRHKNLKRDSFEGLNPGNFLSFAIACRWVSSLNYINNKNWMNDIFSFHFKDCDISTNIIQLKKLNEDQIKEFLDGTDFSKIKPLFLEPEVTFSKTSYTEFSNSDEYDYIFLTQSPNYTPKSSDRLIPVIKEFIKDIE